ncbi:MAG: LysR family transcriptional regulator [Pseudoxanthomonas suwonensis]|nr:LysR family transcriptional regulator [Pseudoxanthomonas suwonensis]
MHDLNDLYYFAKVVEHGGFAPAGRALGIPKSKLSRRVAQLEERLGVRLLHRSTRQFSVTDLGQVFLGHAKAMLVEAEAAVEAIDRSRSEPRGVVRMSCPETLIDYLVGRVVAAFMREHPDVEVHLDATSRPVDPVAEGIDLAIRVRRPPLEDSDLVLKVLGESCQSLVAAPTLLARLGTPTAPAELMCLPSMDLGLPQNQHLWDLYGPDDAHLAINHQPRLVTRGMIALREAAVAGVGVVQLPLLVCEELLERGALVQVLPDWQPRPELIHIVYPSRRGQLPAVRKLIDRMAAEFASHHRR